MNVGLANLNTFAWVGGFSSAPNTAQPKQLVTDAAAARTQLKLLQWLVRESSDERISWATGAA